MEVKGADGNVLQRARYQYNTVLGVENGKSLLFAGRHGVVKNIHNLKFEKLQDGPYNQKNGKQRVKRIAQSRIMVVRFEFQNRMCGFTTVTICNAHLHNMTAKRAQGLKDAHKKFWPRLADYIVLYEVRFLAGDFNMSAFIVIPKLRELGLDINVIAWFPFFSTAKQEVHLDSCALFAIGGGQQSKPHQNALITYYELAK